MPKHRRPPAPWKCCSLVIAGLLTCGCQPGEPSVTQTQLEKAMTVYAQGQFPEAILELEKALPECEDQTQKSNVLTTIGVCHDRLGKFEEALEFHQQAIDTDQGNYLAFVNKGIAHRHLDQLDEAAEMYTEALKLNENYAELHSSMGALALYRNNVRMAISHMERAVELDESSAACRSNLSIAYAAAGRAEAAEKEFAEAKKLGLPNADAIRKRIDQYAALYRDPEEPADNSQ